MINKNDLISVIIPVHNRFDFADQAIQSVISQSYRPIEIIIVDDFSDSPYSPAASNFDDSLTLKIIRTDKNMGPGLAREVGRKAFNGSFLCYMDSDDLWHPEKLVRQYLVFQNNPSVGMCYCQTLEFNHTPICGQEPLRRRNGEAFSTFLPTIFSGRPWSTSSCMWSRNSIDIIGPWINSRTWEDYEYDCRAGCRNIEIKFLPEVLCYKRSGHSEQLSCTDPVTEVAQKYTPILHMADNIISSGKLSDPDIYRAFYGLLKWNFHRLFQYGKVDQAYEICTIMFRISPPFTKKWIISGVNLMLIKLIAINKLFHFLRFIINSQI